MENRAGPGRERMKTALTIAGSDSGGGAGIQADIKTMTVHGVYAMSAVTALTAQNTLGVSEVLPVPPDFLEKQLDAVFEDIPPDAVKIGMIPSEEHVRAVARRLRKYGAGNIVVDPVLSSSSGASFLHRSQAKALAEELFPLAAVVTPNIPETEAFTGLKIAGKPDMEEAARRISRTYGCAVLCKGGHSAGGADDFLFADGKGLWLESPRIPNPNTHGTGCTLSSAIAANLAKGYPLEAAVRRGKDYLTGAIAAMLDLGRGSGPLNHAYQLTKRP